MSEPLRILTNMAFWQSPVWVAATDSLYDLTSNRDPDFLPWWREAFELWRRSPQYEVVVTMGVRESMGYGLLCLVTLRPAKQVMCEVFIDAPRNDLSWHIKNFLYRIVARRAVGLLTNSSAEVETVARRYRLDPSHIRYVPLNTNIENPQVEEEDGGYVLSAGRTLRDYPTLVEAAVRTGLPWVVVCGRDDLLPDPLPPTLRVLRKIPREEYLQTLRAARVVALPLLDTERATGQVVIMEAMSMGKPVVTTRSPGTIDYVRSGENGILVEPTDPKALAKAVLALWEDASLRSRMGGAAVQTMRDQASPDHHATLKLAAIRELLDRRSPVDGGQ